MAEELATKVGPSHIDLAYERLGHRADPPVLLIMGGGAQLIAWPDGFCGELLRHDLQVIRFDSRDSGRSAHFSGGPAPDLAAALAGDFSSASYTLSDMAADSIGLLDALEIGRVHVVGASLGGMVAQTMAIEFPDRVASLTSMMSTTGDRGVGQADLASISGLGAAPEDRPGYIDWQVRAFRVIGSPGFEFDEAGVTDRAARSWDRDPDRAAGMLRQSVAVLASGDRTGALHGLRVPALVLHGADDPMCDVSGGRATAAAIPGAEVFIYPGMGHHLPRALWPDFAGRIAALARRADAAA
jgi:pimeloyl-ACP methyl ester carboxylesterase